MIRGKIDNSIVEEPSAHLKVPPLARGTAPVAAAYIIALLLLGTLSSARATDNCVRPIVYNANGTILQGASAVKGITETPQATNYLRSEWFNISIRVIDNSGFLQDNATWRDDVSLGKRRSEVLMLVLEDIVATLSQARVDSGPAIIFEVVFADLGEDSPAGLAQPVFLADISRKSTIVETPLMQQIEFGIDLYNLLPGVLNHSGRIIINTHYPFDLNIGSCEKGMYSFYSVVAHEFFHLLGVASLIENECLSGSSSTQVKAVSRWDLLLSNNKREPLYTAACEGIELRSVQSVSEQCSDVRLLPEIGGDTLFLEANGTNGCYGDLSHLRGSCYADSVLMGAELHQGVFIAPTDYDLTMLQFLGYSLTSKYSMSFRELYRTIFVRSDIQLPAASYDVIDTVRTDTLAIAVADLLAGDNGVRKIQCLQVSMGDAIVWADNDSVYILYAKPLNGILALTYNTAGEQYIGATGWLFIRYRNRKSNADSLPPCPPNTLCNGSFENVTGPGTNWVKPSDCEPSSIIRYWDLDAGSPDIFVRRRISSPLEGNYDFRFPLAQNFSGIVPDAWSPDDNVYVLLIQGGISESVYSKNYTEGLSQVIQFDSAGSSEEHFVQLRIFDITGNYTPAIATVRVMLSPENVCNWNECGRSPEGSLLDTIIRISRPMEWMLVRTGAFIPKTGRYRLRVTTTNCARASSTWALIDDVRLLSADGYWHPAVRPLPPCVGGWSVASFTFYPGLEKPKRVVVQPLQNNRIRYESTSVGQIEGEPGDNDTYVCRVPFMALSQSKISGDSLNVVTTVEYEQRTVTDTLPLVFFARSKGLDLSVVQAEVLPTSIQSLFRVSKSQEGVVYRGSVAVKTEHKLLWKDDVTLSLSGGEDISLSVDEPYLIDSAYTFPFTLAMPPTITSSMFSMKIGIPAGEENAATIVTVKMEADDRCESAITITDAFRSQSTSVGLGMLPYPNPASEFVFFPIEGVTHDQDIVVVLYDAVGRQLNRRTIQLDNITDPAYYTIRMDVGDLPTGVYSVNAIISDRVWSRRFVVAK